MQKVRGCTLVDMISVKAFMHHIEQRITVM